MHSIPSWIPDVRDRPKTEREEQHEGSLSWTEVMEDTPIFQLLKLIIQQAFGFHAYLLFNISGQPSYKGWVNHYDRTSGHFILPFLSEQSFKWQHSILDPLPTQPTTCSIHLRHRPRDNTLHTLHTQRAPGRRPALQDLRRPLVSDVALDNDDRLPPAH